MNVKEVTVTYGRTINLGNFAFARIDMTLLASLESDDDDGMTFSGEQKAIEALQTLARDAVHAEMARLPRPVEGPSRAVSGPTASAPAGPTASAPAGQPNGPHKAPPVAPGGPPFQPSESGPLF